jgi:hypothetical protein
MAGMLSAGASTPPCGDCSDIWSLEFHHEFPLDVYHGQASSGQPVILFYDSQLWNGIGGPPPPPPSPPPRQPFRPRTTSRFW